MGVGAGRAAGGRRGVEGVGVVVESMVVAVEMGLLSVVVVGAARGMLGVGSVVLLLPLKLLLLLLVLAGLVGRQQHIEPTRLGLSDVLYVRRDGIRG